MMVDAAVKFDGWYDLIIIIRSQYPANDYATNNKALNDILKKVYNTN